MGLAEKRALKSFQEAMFPNLVKEIQSLVNCPVEMDWESISKGENMDPDYWGEALEKMYFRPVIMGLKEVACDEMGKTAIEKGIKKIVFCNLSDTWGKQAISFEDGVLKIDHRPFTNVDDVSLRADHIAHLLIEGL